VVTVTVGCAHCYAATTDEIAIVEHSSWESWWWCGTGIARNEIDCWIHSVPKLWAVCPFRTP
jgi:hypothetical protein